MRSNKLPDASSKQNDRNFSTSQILLMRNTLIGGYEDLKALLLCGIEKGTVLQSIPAMGPAFLHTVAAEAGHNASRRAVIEQNAHSETTDGSLGCESRIQEPP